jgi:hypothetical protein
MKDVSDSVTRNRVRTNGRAVRLLGQYFHQIQQIFLLTTLFILMFPGMTAACGPNALVGVQPRYRGLPVLY